MLSVLYKLASAAIANRMKPCLDQIIDKTQCGFVPGRYIGECTRLILDIMKITEDRHIPGMLVLIDFEKAFDCVSWSFIYQTLAHLGFSEKFIKWIKLFNHNIMATIIQCGVLSDFINIQKGCRQGDPIAPYLFIIVAQILTILIKNNKSIKGVKIGNAEFKLVQFADDTTLILDGTMESLQAAFNTLEIFGTFSGLKVNKDKTQIAWIGKKKASKDKIIIKDCTFSIVPSFKLLGIYISLDLDSCLKLNYSEKIAEIKEIINRWNKRYLTPLGKIAIIKTFLLSKLNHLFLVLPDPHEGYIKEINDIFLKFIWSSKPDKINRQTIVLDKKLGGLKMFNLKYFITSLKVSWIRRLLLTTTLSLWITLFEQSFNVTLHKLTHSGPGYYLLLKNRTKNKFWIDVFSVWHLFTNEYQPHTNLAVITSPLWYNTNMSCHEMFIPNWFEKGITAVSDVLNLDGSIKTLDEVKQKYSINSINPLHYLRVQQNVKKFLKKYKPVVDFNVQRPFIPFYILPIWKNNKGVGAFYKLLLQKEKNNHNMKQKWQFELDINIDDKMWMSIFNVCFNSLDNNSLQWFQLKLIYRILPTKAYLRKINIVDTAECSYCQESETILHMFVECNRIVEFWNEIEELICQIIGFQIKLSAFDKMFGYQNRDRNKIPLNLILLVTKKYILRHKRYKWHSQLKCIEM